MTLWKAANGLKQRDSSGFLFVLFCFFKVWFKKVNQDYILHSNPHKDGYNIHIFLIYRIIKVLKMRSCVSHVSTEEFVCPPVRLRRHVSVTLIDQGRIWITHITNLQMKCSERVDDFNIYIDAKRYKQSISTIQISIRNWVFASRVPPLDSPIFHKMVFVRTFHPTLEDPWTVTLTSPVCVIIS